MEKAPEGPLYPAALLLCAGLLGDNQILDFVVGSPGNDLLLHQLILARYGRPATIFAE